MTEETPRRALVIGATGIVGQNVCARLVDAGWEVFGLSRRGSELPGVHAVRADLSDRAAVAEAVGPIAPEFVAITAWTRMPTEAENIAVNGGAVRSVLAGVGPSRSVRHVSLMTGLKHYLGPFEAYARGVQADTPFREELDRLDYPNFYYAQEDELFAAAAEYGFTWSVHRSHTVFGFATANAMNMALTIGAYATIRKEQGLPFVFPGSAVQWNSVTDVTDADIAGEQMIWAVDEPRAQDQAFNIANGDVFRWRWLWPQIAAAFDLPWEGFDGDIRPFEAQMAGTEDVWRGLADRHGLVEPDLAKVASWWHSDADLGRTIEVLTDMNKSRKAGFTSTRDTRDSFFHYLKRYRAARVLP